MVKLWRSLPRFRHLASSRPVSFSTLERFNILRKGWLSLHPGSHAATTASQTIGSDKQWSNENMHKHISFIISSFNEHKVSSQMVIDTFFFRAIAMVPPSQKAIVMLNEQVPTVRGLPQMNASLGIIDYTAIVVESSLAATYIINPPPLSRLYGGEMTAFPTAVAKLTDHDLPRVILQLVSCAKELGKSHIRGALTTGFMWRFIVVDLDDDGVGAKYWVSDPIKWMWKATEYPAPYERFVADTPDGSDPALIAGILSSWISESHMKFIGDQWFVQKPLRIAQDVIAQL